MSRHSLLVIDDDPATCETLSDIFAAKGYQVSAVGSGRAGLEEAARQAFDAVLIDINLPDISGTEVLRQVRQEHPESVACIITGHASIANAVETLQHGASEYFVKPLDIDAILRRLAGLLEKRQLRRQLEQIQQSILQQEKLATIGQLAAGVAHEINNPIGFIGSNLRSLRKYLEKILEFDRDQAALVQRLPETPELTALRAKRKKMKIDFLFEDILDLVDESLDGTERMKKTVQDLKSFSRADGNDTAVVDITTCIEAALNIAWNEIKYKATVNKEYAELPPVTCYPQQLSQVFMNLLVNGAHAIDKQGQISIRTWAGDDRVFVAISDTGCGIPPENIERIFQPFFTTKDAAKGTGLGMAIAREIVDKHHGSIRVASEVGAGTTFTVELPVSAGEKEVL